MDQKVDETQRAGECNAPERVPFWIVVSLYLLRLSVLGIALFVFLDIDSIEDIIFNWTMLCLAIPFLCVPVFQVLWNFFSDCYVRYQRGYCVRNQWSLPKKWHWEIVSWIGCLLFFLSLASAVMKYTKTGKETIDGVTWRYKIVDGNAVVGRRHPQYCSAISVSITGELTIPSSLGGYPVTGIGEHAFYKCKKLTSVTIPNSVTNIERCAFEQCGGLTSVEIPESVATLDYAAFGSCSSLTTVKLRGKSCPAWGAPFISCPLLAAFEVEPDNLRCKVVDGMLLSKDGTRLLVGVNGDVVIPDGVTKIESKAFSGRKLKSVAMPGTVTDVGESAFENCSGLKAVVLPDGVTSIGAWTFSGCGGLTSVVLPESVKFIGNDAFRGCGNLASITVPSNVVSIGHNAFAGTPFFDNMPDGLVVLSGIAYKWKGVCPEEIKIPEGVTRIYEKAFERCVGLKSVSIPRSLTKIDGYFWTNIKKVYVTKGDVERVKTLFRESENRNIADYAEFVEREEAQATPAHPIHSNGQAK